MLVASKPNLWWGISRYIEFYVYWLGSKRRKSKYGPMDGDGVGGRCGCSGGSLRVGGRYQMPQSQVRWGQIGNQYVVTGMSLWWPFHNPHEGRDWEKISNVLFLKRNSWNPDLFFLNLVAHFWVRRWHLDFLFVISSIIHSIWKWNSSFRFLLMMSLKILVLSSGEGVKTSKSCLEGSIRATAFLDPRW